jgi:hypothetical protein
MILLLGVADFGRIFSAGITLEAAARDAAEATAIERLHNPPDPLNPGDVTYYQRLHVLAAKTVCDEASRLPNSTPQLAKADPPVSALMPGECPDFMGASGVSHPGSPVIRVCVHDGADPICGEAIPGYNPSIPASCPKVQALATSHSNASPGEPVSHLVEVRICYLFTTLFDLHLSLPMNAGLNLGDIWLERSRTFVVDCPTGPGAISGC